MAVPIVNFTIADIQAETGLTFTGSPNINELFDVNKGHINEAYIHRDYCPGGLADLTQAPYQIGDWRGYEAKGPKGYGLLYNWYAVNSYRDMTPTSWRIASKLEYENLISLMEALYGSNNGGRHLRLNKVQSLNFHPYWDDSSGHINPLDTFLFGGVPAGRRTNSGDFFNFTLRSRMWTSTGSGSTAWFVQLRSDTNVIMVSNSASQGAHKEAGHSVRCVQDAPQAEPTGTTGTFTDYNGNVYKWVTIGALRWSMENLKTTHYQDGVEIPLVINNSSWSGATDGARCAPQNDNSYI